MPYQPDTLKYLTEIEIMDHPVGHPDDADSCVGNKQTGMLIFEIML